MRRTVIYGAPAYLRRVPRPRRRSAAGAPPTPHVVQRGAVISRSAERHLQSAGARDRARPASGSGGVEALLLLFVLAVIVVATLAASGGL